MSDIVPNCTVLPHITSEYYLQVYSNLVYTPDQYMHPGQPQGHVQVMYAWCTAK